MHCRTPPRMLAHFPQLSAFGLFAVVSFFVAASPGPTWVYVLTCALSHGRAAAWLCVLGNLFGIGLHIFAAGIGLSLLLASSDNFLFALSELGGLYLIYLGASRFRDVRFSVQKQNAEQRAFSKREVMTKTALINILNPKVLLLFLTLLPQFAEPGKSFFIQSITFGFLHACIASLVLFSVIEVFLAAGRRAALPNSKSWVWFNRLGGAVILAFGVNLLVTPWL